MKTFINTKIGYSAGTNGCTGEYFKLIVFNGDKNLIIHYVGMYGVEERVNELLKNNGYNELYTGNRFGQLKGRDKAGFNKETETLEAIKKWLDS